MDCLFVGGIESYSNQDLELSVSITTESHLLFFGVVLI